MRFQNPKPPAFLALALAVLLVADSGVWVVAVRRASLLSGDDVSSSKFDEGGASAAAAAAGGAPGGRAGASGSGMNVSFVAEYPAYAAGSDATAHSLLSIACPRWEDGVESPPLVLSVVMDKSGSMGGDKIRLLKKTTEFLVTRLSDKDKMGVVAYDSEVTEIMPLRSMDEVGRESALGRISEVEAGGMTHLSGGLLKGIGQQVEEAAAAAAAVVNDDPEQQQQQPPVVRAVLLLTDGLANRGITGGAKMQEAMEEAMGGSRARVYTFGYGSDHDGDLLAGLAEAGSGDYFFIEEDESLPNAFGSVLGGLMATACQDVEVTLTPQDGSVVLDASSGSLGGSEELEDGSLLLRIPDMFAEERKDLVVKMSLGAVPGPLESQPLLRASVKYLDTQRRETLREAASLSTPRPDAVSSGASSSRSMLVLFHRTRLEAADKIKEAKAAADEPCIVHPRPFVMQPRSFASAYAAQPMMMQQQQQQQQQQQTGPAGAAASSVIMPLPPIIPGPMPPIIPGPRPHSNCEGLERAREILSDVLKVVKERKEEAEAAGSDKDILDGYSNLEATVEAVLEGFKDQATYQSSGQYAARSAAGNTASQSVLQAFSAAGAAPQQPAYVQQMAMEAADFVLGPGPQP